MIDKSDKSALEAFGDQIAGKLWNENVTDLNFTLENAAEKLINCIGGSAINKHLETYEYLRIYVVKVLRKWRLEQLSKNYGL